MSRNYLLWAISCQRFVVLQWPNELWTAELSHSSPPSPANRPQTAPPKSIHPYPTAVDKNYEHFTVTVSNMPVPQTWSVFFWETSPSCFFPLRLACFPLTRRFPSSPPTVRHLPPFLQFTPNTYVPIYYQNETKNPLYDLYPVVPIHAPMRPAFAWIKWTDRRTDITCIITQIIFVIR